MHYCMPPDATGPSMTAPHCHKAYFQTLLNCQAHINVIGEVRRISARFAVRRELLLLKHRISQDARRKEAGVAGHDCEADVKPGEALYVTSGLSHHGGARPQDRLSPATLQSKPARQSSSSSPFCPGLGDCLGCRKQAHPGVEGHPVHLRPPAQGLCHVSHPTYAAAQLAKQRCKRMSWHKLSAVCRRMNQGVLGSWPRLGCRCTSTNASVGPRDELIRLLQDCIPGDPATSTNGRRKVGTSCGADFYPRPEH